MSKTERARQFFERLSPKQQVAFLADLARVDFKAFVLRALTTLGIAVEWNWHLDAEIAFAERIAEGDFRYGMVNIPPRSLKSEIFSVILPAYLLAREPNCKIMCVSYSQPLAEKFGASTLRIMRSDWYRKTFPKTILDKTSAGDITTKMGGGRFATSIGGTGTGRGGDIIIIDDPIKAGDAESDAIRTSTNEWIASTLFTRLDAKLTGRMLFVAQRLHQDDPCGRFIENGDWQVLSIPAIATEGVTYNLGHGRVYDRQAGEVMHPAREPLGLLEDFKVKLGARRFAAQYQQEPVPADGSFFRREWLKTDPAFRRRAGDRVVQAWDAASKDGDHNDFSVCVTAVIRRRQIFIIDVFRTRLAFPALKQKTIELAREYQPSKLVIEDAAGGTPLIQVLRDERPSKVPTPIGIKASANKIERAMMAAAKAEQGDIILPEDARWKDDFVNELMAFPFGRHDDQVDALAHLVSSVSGDVATQFATWALPGGDGGSSGGEPDIMHRELARGRRLDL